MKVHVLHWQYSDKSGDGIVGVFDDEEKAKELYDFAEQHSDACKTFYLDSFTLNEIKPQEK
jgi:hypothetical protein